MKNVIRFWVFVIYSTSIFFIQKTIYLLIPIFLNVIFQLIYKIQVKKCIKKILKILPFILFTVFCDVFLMSINDAIIIGIKLFIVCHITYLFGQTMTKMEVADVIIAILKPFKFLKVSKEDIRLLVCISISMLPVLNAQLKSIKQACISKDMKWNFRNVKYILGYFLVEILKRATQIDEAVTAKKIMIED